MARIELSNIGGGTTLSLTTTGTSGASTLAGSVLNIPVYQGQLTLTTTGTSGAATLAGDILNIPQYSGGGTPAGNAGEVQFNSTPAGSFAASANLAWDNSNVRLNIGAPSAPTGTLNVRGGGTTSGTSAQIWTNSGNTELMRVRDDGNTGIGTSAPSARLHILGAGNSTTTTSFLAQNSSSERLISARDDGRIYIGSQSDTQAPFLAGYTGTTPHGASQRALGIVWNGGTTQRPNPAMLFTASSSVGWTSGVGDMFQVFFTFNPTSGTGVLNSFIIQPTINQTGGANGVSRGLYVNPNLISSSDWRSIEWSNNTGYGIYGVGTASNYLAGNTVIGTTTPSARLHVRGANTTAGVGALLIEDGAATPATIYRIDNDGKVTYRATNTAAGTTGAQTINRPSGTVNFGIGAGSLVVTNSLCTTSSIVFATVRTNDATAYIKNVVPAAGSFTINLGANATAETSVGFFIIN